MKKILLILTVGLFISSCESDDFADPINPNDFPTATFSLANPSDAGATITEDSDGVVVNVMTDKAVNNGTSFGGEQVGGTAIEGEDFEIKGSSISAFGNSTTVSILPINNPFPKTDRTVVVEVGPDVEFAEALLNPNTQLPFTVSFTITDVNPTTGVNVGLAWDEDAAADLDLEIVKEDGSTLRFGPTATGENPEIGVLLLNTDPDGTYYLDLNLFDIEGTPIDFNFGISDPNGSVSEFNGTFDVDNLDQYTFDANTDLGGSYRLIKIVKSGTTYTITQLF